MTYAVNQRIQASDYNALVTSAKTIYGVGSGEYGYGQSAISLVSSVTASVDQISTSHWKPLRNVLQVLANHQGTSVTLPSDPNLDLNHLIRAYPGLLNAVTDTTTNRHSTSNTSMTLYPSLVMFSYSSAWTTSISFSFDATWSTADKARYFWNSGGQLLIRLNYTPLGTTPRGTAWSSFVNQLGGFEIDWNKARMISNYPGTNTSANLGYYGLPTSPILLWQGFNTQGSYSFPANNIALYGQSVDGPQGANGDNGKHLRFTMYLNDVATTGTDSVTGTWNASVDVSKATTYLTQETPTVTSHAAFSGT